MMPCHFLSLLWSEEFCPVLPLAFYDRIGAEWKQKRVVFAISSANSFQLFTCLYDLDGKIKFLNGSAGASENSLKWWHPPWASKSFFFLLLLLNQAASSVLGRSLVRRWLLGWLFAVTAKPLPLLDYSRTIVCLEKTVTVLIIRPLGMCPLIHDDLYTCVHGLDKAWTNHTIPWSCSPSTCVRRFSTARQTIVLLPFAVG